MRRREFITLIGGMAAIPFAARAQQGERTRRIGVLSSVAQDSETKALQAVFRQALEQLGWTDGRNVQVVTRFGQGDTARTREYAAELVALAPDVILSTGAAATEPNRADRVRNCS
jgi:putative tryptophan/tyrosine transport system substrate-binding protein